MGENVDVVQEDDINEGTDSTVFEIIVNVPERIN